MDCAAWASLEQSQPLRQFNHTPSLSRPGASSLVRLKMTGEATEPEGKLDGTSRTCGTGWNIGKNTHHHMATAPTAEKSPCHQSWSLIRNLSWSCCWVVHRVMLPLGFSKFTAEIGTFCSFLVNVRQIIKYQSEIFKFDLKELNYRVLT